MAAVSQLKNREVRRMILGIDNVGVAVRDRERSMAFYQNLGFRKTFQNERGSTMTAGSTKLFLFPAADRGVPLRKITLEANPPGIDHLSFLVDDVDRTNTELTARGVSFLASPADQSWGARTAVLRDPDGNNRYLLTWRHKK
jgi:lactoylglutathione lyase